MSLGRVSWSQERHRDPKPSHCLRLSSSLGRFCSHCVLLPLLSTCGGAVPAPAPPASPLPSLGPLTPPATPPSRCPSVSRFQSQPSPSCSTMKAVSPVSALTSLSGEPHFPAPYPPSDPGLFSRRSPPHQADPRSPNKRPEGELPACVCPAPPTGSFASPSLEGSAHYP